MRYLHNLSLHPNFHGFLLVALIAVVLLGPSRPTDAQKPRLVVETGHTGWITCLAYSPDGKTLATGSDDDTVRLWDAATGQLRTTLTGSTNPITCLAFSPDGKILATGSEDGLQLWDAATGQVTTALEGDTLFVNSIAFSPTGTALALGFVDGTIKLFDTKTRRLNTTLTGHSDDIRSIAFSPDGKTLASGNDDGTVRLWDTSTGHGKATLRQTSHEKSGDVTPIAFSPDGKTLASGSDDGTVRLWDTDTGHLKITLTGHLRDVTSVAFSRDGKTLASGSDDGTVRLWDADTGRGKATLRQTSRVSTVFVSCVAFSPNGKTLATGGADVCLWDMATRQQTLVLKGRTAWVSSVAFSPDGKTLAGGSLDDTIKVWDAVTGQMRATLRQTPRVTGMGSVYCIAFSPDGRTIAGGNLDRTIGLWDADTGQLKMTLTGHLDEVTSLAYSRDGKTLASGSLDGTVKLWDTAAATGKLKATLQETPNGPRESVNAVAFSPDGTTIADGVSDLAAADDVLFRNTVHLWDTATGQLKTTLTEVSDGAKSVAFSPDGGTLASGGTTISLWDADGGRLKTTLDAQNFGPVYTVAFSPDGRTIAGSGDSAIHLWDTTTGRIKATLLGHTDDVRSVAFSPDGKALATGGDDGTTRLWDTATGRELASLIALDTSDWAVVTPDGRFDASPGGMRLMHYVVGSEIIDLAQLKGRYYEPGLLSKLLGFSRDPLRDIQAFDHVALFPAVTAPATVPPSGRLTLALTNRGGGIGRVQVFVNGVELRADARGPGVSPDAPRATVTVDVSRAPSLVPGRPNAVTVVTWNREGSLCSRGTGYDYVPRGAAPSVPPSLYAIVVGVDRYASPDLGLTYPDKDAQGFAHALEVGARGLLVPAGGSVHVTLLNTSGKPGTRLPTKADIAQAFTAARQAGPGDILVVYLAGHGVALPGGGSDGADDQYCYLTEDATTGRPSDLAHDSALRGQTSVSSEELTAWLKLVPARKKVMILDTCAAGAALARLTAKRAIPSSQTRAVERLKDRTGFYVLMGCAADSVSYETSRYAEGLLTYALLEGIKGAALRDGQYVDVEKLFGYVVDEVPRLAGDIGGVQRPFVAAPEAASFDVGMLSEADRASIPLSAPLPMVLRPKLVTLDEDLHLDTLVSEQLRDAAQPSSRGTGGPVLSFVDAAEFPGAIQPSGIYTITADQVQVTMKLRRDGQVLKTLTLSGARSDQPALVARIAAAIEEAVRGM
jgi:WD40 repeat protein